MFSKSFMACACAALAACSQQAYDPTDTRVPPASSLIAGQTVLNPSGCRSDTPRICQLGAELRFSVPAQGGLTWASKIYDLPASQDGTTDGASIPAAVWSLVGLPYDPLFIRPAILHDHYTYQENLVRRWQDTHRMFFYALIEEGVDPIRAQIMFYAVYTFGGHWTDVVDGEPCGEVCVQFSRDATQLIYYPPTLDSPQAAREIQTVYAALLQQDEARDDVRSLAEPTPMDLLRQIEALAQDRNPAGNPLIDMGVATFRADANDSVGREIARDLAVGRAVIIDKPTRD